MDNLRSQSVGNAHLEARIRITVQPLDGDVVGGLEVLGPLGQMLDDVFENLRFLFFFGKVFTGGETFLVI